MYVYTTFLWIRSSQVSKDVYFKISFSKKITGVYLILCEVSGVAFTHLSFYQIEAINAKLPLEWRHWLMTWITWHLPASCRQARSCILNFHLKYLITSTYSINTRHHFLSCVLFLYLEEIVVYTFTKYNLWVAILTWTHITS